MSRHNHARATVPPPRQTEIWQEEIPGTHTHNLATTIADDVLPVAQPALKRLRQIIECATYSVPAWKDEARQALASLDRAIEDLEALPEKCATNVKDAEELYAHAEALQTACVEMADRASEADEIRDAIERYPHTAHDVWRDALRIVRSGGNVRDMWAGGKR